MTSNNPPVFEMLESCSLYLITNFYAEIDNRLFPLTREKTGGHLTFYNYTSDLLLSKWLSIDKWLHISWSNREPSMMFCCYSGLFTVVLFPERSYSIQIIFILVINMCSSICVWSSMTRSVVIVVSLAHTLLPPYIVV